METFCKLGISIPLLFCTNSTSWNFLAPSGLLTKTLGSKEGLTLMTYLRAPGHVWPEERRCRHTGENLYRGYQPYIDSEKPERDFSKVLANGNGGGVGWCGDASCRLALYLNQPSLGFMRCYLDPTLLHVSASTDLGVEGSSISRPNYLSLFPRYYLLVYLRIPQRVSFSPFLMVPERFLLGSMSIRAGLSSSTPQKSKQEKQLSSCLSITCIPLDFLINANFLAANTFSIHLDTICWSSLPKYNIKGFHWFSWAPFTVNQSVSANFGTHSKIQTLRNIFAGN